MTMYQHWGTSKNVERRKQSSIRRHILLRVRIVILGHIVSIRLDSLQALDLNTTTTFIARLLSILLLLLLPFLIKLLNDLIRSVKDPPRRCTTCTTSGCFGIAFDSAGGTIIVTAPGNDRIGVVLSTDEAGKRDVFVV